VPKRAEVRITLSFWQKTLGYSFHFIREARRAAA
jgi:hypothetical protein